MENHPIESLMKSAMDSIQNMIDVDTIIGDPIDTPNNMVIIPISKVSLGFASGGSEFKGETLDEYKKKDKEEEIQYRLPFGGGAGAGVSIVPVAFLIVNSESIKLLPVEHSSTIDKLLDYVPDFMEKVNSIVNKTIDSKDSSTNKDTVEEKTETVENKRTVSKTRKPKKINIEYSSDNKAEEYLEDE